MPSQEIRKKFLEFFAQRGHAVIPSASLVPENDATVLFTTAGMQPLVPYLLGQPHPLGTRVVNVQKCVRTGDIDDVGDNRHLTFFEMLGNWSFGDYFKKDAIAWSYELLTSKEGFGLDPKRLYVTCFEGNNDAPRDDESFETWKSAGIPPERIFFLGADDNWWSPGDNGPCGPDSEMFYDLHPEQGAISGRDAFIAANESGRVVEIWNDVFMEYERRDGNVVGKLARQNVDTGSGLERMAVVLQEKHHVFETDLFVPIMAAIMEHATAYDERSARIIADHVRAAVFMIGDGVLPSNTDRGYVLRRLIRRAVRFADALGMKTGHVQNVVAVVIKEYAEVYPELKNETLSEVFRAEETKFRHTLERGLREFEKIPVGYISGAQAAMLYQSYGFPFELIEELAGEKGSTVNKEEFDAEMKRHQETSRVGAEQKFKGGLGGHGDMELKYHTATHLLNAALKHVLGPHVKQRGSNITSERLRFDFSHPEKLTDEQKKRIEEFMNEKISEGLPVIRKEMPKTEAERLGAEMEFGGKYPDVVSVYFIGTPDGEIVSREFCGGPHVENTNVLGTFKITKEESVAAGIRRIKAVLE